MISDHPGASRIRRRRFLGGAAALSLGGLALPAAGTARGFEYGILGRAAPEFEVDYWVDRNGEPTTYSIGAMRGKWIFLKCFQNGCPGCHLLRYPLSSVRIHPLSFSVS